jgi:site-specific recombinase XerD
MRLEMKKEEWEKREIENARDSAKWYTRRDMAGDQASLFDRKKYIGILPQTYQIEPPDASHSVLKTLLAYNTYLRSGGYSKYTPDDFTSDVKKFGLFVKDKKLKDIKTVDIQQWIGEIKKVMKEKTVSRKISAVTNYFNWLAQEKVLTENPAQSIRYIRVTSPLPDILFDEECQKLLAAASVDPRSYLLVLLLLDTGMKKEELFDLKLIHFDFSDKYAPELWLKHTGKKISKDRKLKLPHEVVPVFHEYEVLSKLKKVVTFRGKPPNSIVQNRELGGKYSDERSEKRTLSVRPD